MSPFQKRNRTHMNTALLIKTSTEPVDCEGPPPPQVACFRLHSQSISYIKSLLFLSSDFLSPCYLTPKQLPHLAFCQIPHKHGPPRRQFSATEILLHNMMNREMSSNYVPRPGKASIKYLFNWGGSHFFSCSLPGVFTRHPFFTRFRAAWSAQNQTLLVLISLALNDHLTFTSASEIEILSLQGWLLALHHCDKYPR